MPRNTYSKKINEWDLDIEYNYVPAEPAIAITASPA